MLERYLTPYLLLPLIQALFSMALMVIVLREHRRSFVHRLFSLFLLALTFWGIGILGMRASPDIEHAYYWERYVLPVSCFMSVFFYHFTVSYTDTKISKWLLALLYIICFLFIPFIFSTRLILSGMQIKSYGYAPILGPAAPLWVLFNYGVMTTALVVFVKSYRRTRNAEQKNRFAYIIAGLSLCFVGIAFDLLPVLGLPLYPGGIIANIFLCSLTTIAIIKYNLLDIHIVLRKSTAYVLTSAVVAIPFVGLFVLATKAFVEIDVPSWAYFGVAIMLALLLPQLWQWFQQWVDRWFYRNRYDYLKTLETFSQQTQSLTDSAKLGSTMVNLVAKALRSSNVCLLQPLARTSDFAVSSSASANSSTASILLNSRSPLVKWLKRHDDILAYEDLVFSPNYKRLAPGKLLPWNVSGQSLSSP